MARTTKEPTHERLQAAIDALLAAWRKVGGLDAPGALSGGDDDRAIDAGSYGDPHKRRELPDEWRGDTDGWQLLSRLRR
jgi:hypothetical protein